MLILTRTWEKDSGTSKGFRFIEMNDVGSAQAIEALHGDAFDDRQLEVRFAEGKQGSGQTSNLPTEVGI